MPHDVYVSLIKAFPDLAVGLRPLYDAPPEIPDGFCVVPIKPTMEMRMARTPSMSTAELFEAMVLAYRDSK
jgi:hypothetical protein